MSNTKLQIYTDGHHGKGNKHDVSYGACLIDGNKGVYTHSGRLDVEEFHKRYNEWVSNPTAELYAAVKMLGVFKDAKNVDIIIFSDYKGVQEWIAKRWKAKKPYIADLLKYAYAYIDRLESNGSTVSFEWVKGHSGNEYNEIADSLCLIKPHDELSAWVERHNLAEKKKAKEKSNENTIVETTP